MATVDLTGGAGAALPFQQKHFRLKQRVTIPDTAVTADIFNTIPVKKGWLVQGTAIVPVTAGVGGTITANVGIADTAITGYDVDGFDAAVNLENAVGTVSHSAPGTDAYATAGGYWVTADTTIDITMADVTSAITTEPVFDIIAYGIDCN